MTGARILFVDDEVRILEGLGNVLYEREAWTLAFAQSGEEALRRLRAEPPYDILVTDMRMPGMDGLTLLQTVLVEFPHMMRMVLSGDAAMQTAVKGIMIAHGYLAKPCDARALGTTLERLLRIGTSVRDDRLRQSLGRICEPTCGQMTAPRIGRIAEDRPLVELARVVAGDVVLATKVVQAANSAIFGGAPTTTIVAAVMRVGVDGVRALAVALDVYGRFGAGRRDQADAHQAHALRIAQLASAIAAPAEREHAYLCGLLHDLGTMTLATQPARLARCHEAWLAGAADLCTLERDEFGIDHATLGAEILELLGMPHVADVLRFHHAPALHPPPIAPRAGAPLGALAALHIADAVFLEGDRPALELDPAYMAALGAAGTQALARARRLAEVL